jgi:hypothetical protein
LPGDGGVLLIALAVGGGLLELVGLPRLVPGFLEFDWTHDALHVFLLGLAAYMGFWASYRVGLWYARIYGFGGLAIAVAGALPTSQSWLHSRVGLHLEIGENLVHALIGIWGLAVGFLGPVLARKTRTQSKRRGAWAT